MILMVTVTVLQYNSGDDILVVTVTVLGYDNGEDDIRYGDYGGL